MYLICEKEVKSTGGLTRHLNIYKGHIYPKPAHEPLQYKFDNEENLLSGNWEDGGHLLGKTVILTIANATP